MNFNTKTKVLIIYILTFVLILLNVPLFNGVNAVETVLRSVGINTFHSQGDTGFYYPTIVMFVIGVLFWMFLLKTAPKSKASKNYFYYCFGMMTLLAIINNALQ